MQSLRRFRKLIALVAIIWLPMSVFAQVCATQATVAAIGGMDHPGLVQPGDSPQHVGHGAVVDAPVVTIVVDAETFWHSVDSFDGSCDMQFICALAGFALMPPALQSAMVFAESNTPFVRADLAFATRSLTPDTPPPRLAL